MPTLQELVERVRTIPYGRPSERTAAAVLAEGRGTCSTKHLLLRDLAREAAPDADVKLMHRVYALRPARAATLFGEHVASAVPESGLVDVHTPAAALVGGRRVRVDVTFPGGPPWDGRSDMPLACGDGIDVDAGDEPLCDEGTSGRRTLRRPGPRALRDRPDRLNALGGRAGGGNRTRVTSLEG